MNKYENAIESLKEGIISYIDEKLSKLDRDKTYTAYVLKSIPNNLYDIKLNGKTYKNVSTIGGTCKVGQSVYVLIPQGNYNNMVILK